jgi:hypothetical protein
MLDAKSFQHQENLKDMFIIDTGSTIGATVTNPNLLTGLRPSKATLCMQTNAGTNKKLNLVGDVMGFGEAWYHPDMLTNIFSFSKMAEKHRYLCYLSKQCIPRSLLRPSAHDRVLISSKLLFPLLWLPNKLKKKRHNEKPGNLLQRRLRWKRKKRRPVANEAPAAEPQGRSTRRTTSNRRVQQAEELKQQKEAEIAAKEKKIQEASDEAKRKQLERQALCDKKRRLEEEEAAKAKKRTKKNNVRKTLIGSHYSCLLLRLMYTRNLVVHGRHLASTSNSCFLSAFQTLLTTHDLLDKPII